MLLRQWLLVLAAPKLCRQFVMGWRCDTTAVVGVLCSVAGFVGSAQRHVLCALEKTCGWAVRMCAGRVE
jgi:hypothetical protein